MPRPKQYKCKFCHSVVDQQGLCGTCRSYFLRHKERTADRLRACTSGYSLSLPTLEPGQTLTLTLTLWQGVEE